MFLTRAEFAVLRDCAKPEVRDLLTVFVGTGLRYAELVALQVRDVNLLTTPPTVSLVRSLRRYSSPKILTTMSPSSVA